jgi:hypothetical protein
MHCVELLVRLTGGASHTAFEAVLAEEGQRLSRELSGKSTVRVAHSAARHRGDIVVPRASLAALDELLSKGLPPAHSPVAITDFDAVLELRVADDVDPHRIVSVLDGLGDRLGPGVDSSRSATVMGTDHVLIDGGGAVQLFYCLRRVPEMSRAAFNDYWLHQLTKHTSKTPRKTGYRQVHADPAFTTAAARSIGVMIDDFDGVALEWYQDFDGLLTATKWAGTTPDVVEAETRMIDFAAARSMLSYSPD